MNTQSLIHIKLLQHSFQVWAYISEECPFHCILGEEFLKGRITLDYTKGEVQVAVGAEKTPIPKIASPPWGQGKPNAKLLHQNSSIEEQDAVLHEDLKTVEGCTNVRLRTVVTKYIHKFHKQSKFGWVPSNWREYKLDSNHNKTFRPQRLYSYNNKQKKFIDRKLDMWIARGFGRETNSKFVMPIVCTNKPQPANDKF